MESSYTFGDLLALPYFVGVSFYGGEEALEKNISWCFRIHDNLLNTPLREGGLFFISANEINENYHAFLQKFIASNAGGLCIDNASGSFSFNNNAIALAEETKFPIIICEKVLPFTNIIETVNTAIMSFYSEPEEIKAINIFYRGLVEIGTKAPLIQYLTYSAGFLGGELCYWHILFSEKVFSHHFSLSPLTKDDLNEIELKGESEISAVKGFLVIPIHVLNERYAYLILKKSKISHYDTLVFKKLHTFLKTRVLADFITRLQYEHSVDSSWVNAWFSGNLKNSEAFRKLEESVNLKKIRPSSYFCLVSLIPEGGLSTYNYHTGQGIANDNYLLNSILLFRPFYKNNIYSVHHIEKNIIQFICIIPSELTASEHLIDDIIASINANPSFKKLNSRACLGKIVKDIKDIPESYHEAYTGLNMAITPKDKAVFRYTDLHCLKILNILEKEQKISLFIQEELGILLESENESLLLTLKTYLYCSANKKETAQKLFITRQTLYMRLKHIEKLLNISLSDNNARLALSLAFMALEYFNK